MFENASFMVMYENGNSTLEIRKLETDLKAQRKLIDSFSKAYSQYLDDKEKIEFDGNYKPDDKEILYIPNFDIPQKILYAIEKPYAIPSFTPDYINGGRIKAIFTGSKSNSGVCIAFQRFKKEQYIDLKGISLFFDKNTFVEESRFGISVSDEIDCVYKDGHLLFSSFYMARQIFDLSEYYREATEKDIQNFVKAEKIHLMNDVTFIYQADSTVRRRIASILDSGTLSKYSAKKIKKIAEDTANLKLTVKNDKIVIPTEKKQMKIILAFLDEGVYKGVFSNEVFMTNSKRAVGK